MDKPNIEALFRDTVRDSASRSVINLKDETECLLRNLKQIEELILPVDPDFATLFDEMKGKIRLLNDKIYDNADLKKPMAETLYSTILNNL
jgi:hypothetical protein|tara:strand:- start:3526 stop:3798 length:273 start_codon:yes stop_codon:yes gene_type:complete